MIQKTEARQGWARLDTVTAGTSCSHLWFLSFLACVGKCVACSQAVWDIKGTARSASCPEHMLTAVGLHALNLKRRTWHVKPSLS